MGVEGREPGSIPQDGTGQGAHIGEHVTGVRNQGQRLGQYSGRRLDSHIGDDQAERNRKVAAVGLGRNIMAVARVSVSQSRRGARGKRGPGVFLLPLTCLPYDEHTNAI